MYLSFLGLQTLARTLPLGMVRWLGRSLGLVAYALLRPYRRQTLIQLEQALGQDVPASKRRRIARGVFMHLGENAVEWLRLPRLSGADLQQLIDSEGVEHLRRAMAKGAGAIVVTAHFGNWELIPIFLRSLGFEGAVLARRLRYPEYESFLIGMRGDKGVPTLARGAMKDVARLLRANQIVGLMPDQDIDSLDGVFVTFFGRPAYTPVGPAALSLMTGAPILPCFLIRQGRRFRLMMEPPIPTPQTRDRAEALVHITQAWSDVVESYIRRYPDHWVWMHQRWKTQPPPTPVAGPSAAGLTPTTPSGPSAMVQPALSVLTALSLLGAFGAGGCGRSSTSRQSSMSHDASATDGGRTMSGFSLAGYNVDGTKRWDLRGEGANLDGNVVTVYRPDGIGYDVAVATPAGPVPGGGAVASPQADAASAGDRTLSLQAGVAQVDQTTRHIRMEQEVTLHTSDGLWLTAPVLHWLPDEKRMATDTPVRIETATMVVKGRGLEGYTQLQQATILEDVELVLSPSADGGPAGPALQSGAGALGAPPKARGKPSHVHITCEGPLAFDYTRDIATFERQVHVQDSGGDLYADRLIAYLEPATHTIRYAEAMGHVRIDQQQHTAQSERAVYEPGVGRITLVGRPSLLIVPSGGADSSSQSVLHAVGPMTSVAPGAR